MTSVQQDDPIAARAGIPDASAVRVNRDLFQTAHRSFADNKPLTWRASRSGGWRLNGAVARLGPLCNQLKILSKSISYASCSARPVPISGGVSWCAATAPL